MTCREFVDFLMDYLEGTLPGEQLGSFQAHMDECPPCITYIETYRETIRLGRLACGPDDTVPEDVPDALVEAILAARREG